MLWAYLFTFSTFDAGARFSIVYGMNHIVVIICIPVMKYLLGIHAGKQIRNRNVFRAAFHPVTADAYSQIQNFSLHSQNTFCHSPFKIIVLFLYLSIIQLIVYFKSNSFYMSLIIINWSSDSGKVQSFFQHSDHR